MASIANWCKLYVYQRVSYNNQPTDPFPPYSRIYPWVYPTGILRLKKMWKSHGETTQENDPQTFGVFFGHVYIWWQEGIPWDMPVWTIIIAIIFHDLAMILSLFSHY